MNIREHHNIAMEIADQADMLKAMKDTEGAIRLYAEAFEKEREMRAVCVFMILYDRCL